jgi:hypothetical protein
MKTKNFLLTGALLIVALFSVNGVMAQITSDKSAQTQVNIILKGIQSIEVSSDEVNMTYSTIDHYTEGVTAPETPILTVYSSGSFAVSVRSEGEFFNTIENGAVTIKATPTMTGASPVTAVLNTGAAVETTDFISSTTGGFGLDYTLEFSHKFESNDLAFANTINDGVNGDTHPAIVVYEITAN